MLQVAICFTVKISSKLVMWLYTQYNDTKKFKQNFTKNNKPNSTILYLSLQTDADADAESRTK